MRQAHILAGDIGGTKTHLALYRTGQGTPQLVGETIFASQAYGALEEVVQSFLGDSRRIDAAAFGIAGPVIDGRVTTTNLPWSIEPDAIRAAAGCDRVALLNDLETTALGALDLPAEAFHVLQAGVARRGNVAVIAAGTGLGQSFLFWDGRRFRPSATEGGHADFAPATAVDVALLNFAQQLHGHVSWERVVSGPGLHLLFRFLTEHLGRPIAPAVRERLPGADPSAVIGAAGVAGECDTCVEAVDWFVRLYGAQAGNLALSIMALGGVIVGGGIVARLLPRIANGTFTDAFASKGRYQSLLRQIPVRAMIEPRASLFGAVHAAIDLLDDAAAPVPAG